MPLQHGLGRWVGCARLRVTNTRATQHASATQHPSTTQQGCHRKASSTWTRPADSSAHAARTQSETSRANTKRIMSHAAPMLRDRCFTHRVGHGHRGPRAPWTKGTVTTKPMVGATRFQNVPAFKTCPLSKRPHFQNMSVSYVKHTSNILSTKCTRDASLASAPTSSARCDPLHDPSRFMPPWMRHSSVAGDDSGMMSDAVVARWSPGETQVRPR